MRSFEYFQLGLPALFILLSVIGFGALIFKISKGCIACIRKPSAFKTALCEFFTLSFTITLAVCAVTMFVIVICIGLGVITHHVFGINIQHADRPPSITEQVIDNFL